MKKIAMMLAVVVLSVNVLSAAVVTTDTVGYEGAQFDIEFVTISGDTNPTSGYGQVTGDYRMGRLEISNDQFAKFASNNNVYFTGADVPSNRVTWFEAAKFVNYLNTSTGNDTAYKFTTDVMGVWEDGENGYDENNPYRNSNAKYFLPTEDEWVKAAYWNSTSLQLQTYANALPSDLLASGSPDPTKWNYSPSAGDEPWNVGSGADELNGTKNMMGNVWEWMESPHSGVYLSGSYRGIRGGSYYNFGSYLSSSGRSNGDPYFEYDSVGFRVASTVPEPASLILLSVASLALRRRKN